MTLSFNINFEMAAVGKSELLVCKHFNPKRRVFWVLLAVKKMTLSFNINFEMAAVGKSELLVCKHFNPKRRVFWMLLAVKLFQFTS